tara:strand:- start:8585 stop:9220 length:636 start_codon:yes stop_codon:yes gene_type:complete
MKSYVNNWRGFLNEGIKEAKQLKIKKIDGSDPMVDVKWESENWFIWNMGKVKGKSLWSINHKASGAAIPSEYYVGGVGAAKNLIINVLEPLNLPDISSNSPSDESIAAIRQALIDSDYVNPALSWESMSENMIRHKIESELALFEIDKAEVKDLEDDLEKADELLAFMTDNDTTPEEIERLFDDETTKDTEDAENSKKDLSRDATQSELST